MAGQRFRPFQQLVLIGPVGPGNRVGRCVVLFSVLPTLRSRTENGTGRTDLCATPLQMPRIAGETFYITRVN